MVEAVLFDWGDTLVEGVVWTDELLLEGNRAGLEAVAGDGLPTAEELAAYLRDHEAELFPPGAEDEVDLAAIVHRCFAELGRPLSDYELESFLEASQGDWLSREQVHPDVHAVLDELCARGLRLAIVSNCATPRRFVDRALEEQGLLERMDAIVFSCEVGKVKPHPAIFERALAELEVEAAAGAVRRRPRRAGRPGTEPARHDHGPGALVLRGRGDGRLWSRISACASRSSFCAP